MSRTGRSSPSADAWSEHEVPLVVSVDDCGEIYARLAEPADALPMKAPSRLAIDGTIELAGSGAAWRCSRCHG